MQKIGLFAGSFNPVHVGHVNFVLESIRQLNLDEVVVVPETKPRHKEDVVDISHRKSMLDIAFANNQNVKVVVVAAEFSVFPDMFESLMLPKLVYLLIGTDVALTIKTWSNFPALKERVHLIIGVRDEADAKRIHTLMAHLEFGGSQYSLIRTETASTSSSKARKGDIAHLPKVNDYIQKHHLYEV